MTTENGIGIQTRAITEAQCMKDGAQRQSGNNPERVQDSTQLQLQDKEHLIQMHKIQP